jgi:23S rRNA maturation mini-RNase III
MNCLEVQSLLLQSEMNQAPDGVFVRFSGDAAARGVADHLATCAACNQLARKLRRLEKAVRSLPEPIDMADAKHRFIAKLQGMDLEPTPMPMPAPARRRRVVHKSNILWRIADSRLTAAALVLLVIGGSIWTYRVREHQLIASAQAMNSLVEWNLRLAEAKSTAERKRLYDARAEAEKQLASRAHFNAADRKQANTLIQNVEFLSTNEDPLAEADHFSQVAEVLITKMDSLASKAPETLDRLSDTYYRVVDQGIQQNLDRAAAAGPSTPVAQKQIEAIDQRNAMLQSKVEALLEKNPSASQPQLRKALDLQKQKGHQRNAKSH